MGYNLSGLSLFNQSSSATNVYASQNTTIFYRPVATFGWTLAYGQSIAPLLLTSLSGTVSFAYGQKISGSISSSSTISNVYGLNINVNMNGGTVSSIYNLYVSSPTYTSGTITNICTAYFGIPTVGTNAGGVGIGTTSPTNALDIYGGMSIGSYAGSQTASFGVVAVSGPVSTTPYMGVRTPHPTYYTDIQGTMQAGAAYGWMPMGIQQKGTISQGWNSLGGGTVGNSKQVSTVSVSIYNPQLFQPFGYDYGLNWSAAGFDGRYVYYAPAQLLTSTYSSMFIRYDTTLPYNVSTSYSYFNMLNLNSLCTNFVGSCFDGRYIYMASDFNFYEVNNYILVSYDTWSPFNQIASYSVMNTLLINSLASGLYSPVYTGDYIYFGAITGNLFIRYSLTGSFTSPSSYQFFSMNSVDPGINGIYELAYDGQFIYIAGYGSATSNFLVSYNTMENFSSASSYTTFNLSQISGFNGSIFLGACFDGRFLYFSPHGNSAELFSGQVLRYDTTLPFTATGSYAFVDLGAYGGSSYTGYRGTLFDGRYVYFVPSDNFTVSLGVIAQYDTFLPFNITVGFSFLQFPAVNSNLYAFFGAVYDGNYVYLPPNEFLWIIRIDAYRGYPTSSLFAANQASNGFILGTGLVNPITSPTVSAGTLQVPSLPVGYINLQSGKNVIHKIPYYN